MEKNHDKNDISINFDFPKKKKKHQKDMNE